MTTKTIKTAILAAIMLTAGIVGLAWFFGDDADSLAWLVASKPLGAGLLVIAYRLKEQLKKIIRHMA